MAVSNKEFIFWGIIACSRSSDFLGENFASIIRVVELDRHETSIKHAARIDSEISAIFFL
jgi:hypothetical protein